MKVLEINKFNFIKGGADKHFLDVCRLLKLKGHEVAVFAMDHPKNIFTPWKKYFVSFVGYDKKASLWQKFKGVGRMFYSFEANRRIKKLLNDFEPDIVHIHNIYHQISPSILKIFKKRGIPVVMTVHDYKLICPDYLLQCKSIDWEGKKRGRYIAFVKNKCFKNSYLKSLLVALESKFHALINAYDANIDIYISPSQFTKNKLVRAGFSRSKIIVLPHFFIENSRNQFCRLGKKEKYALYFGKISKEKGAGELINIFKNIPDIKLYLAGEKDASFRLPKDDSVKYLGFLKSEELEQYIKSSLFVVSCSKLPETFGLIALEAIKNAKSFIGYKSGAYREIIENNKTGYLCENKKEFIKNILKLSEDDGLRILLSRNALEKSKNFDSNKYYEKLIRIFEELLAE
jgi:glycosyltransferase involved in cell wall biosynthesis